MAVAIDFDAVRCTDRAVSPCPVVRTQRRALGLPLPAVEFTCLVVTGDELLRRRLSAAAELVGWDTVDSALTTPELVAASQRDQRLVVVDLANPPRGDGGVFHETVREMAARPDTLVVVCGSATDQAQEVWARSLGAFVYVPGVAAGDPLVAVFREARTVSERRHAPSVDCSSPSVPRLECVRG